MTMNSEIKPHVPAACAVESAEDEICLFLRTADMEEYPDGTPEILRDFLALSRGVQAYALTEMDGLTIHTEGTSLRRIRASAVRLAANAQALLDNAGELEKEEQHDSL